MFDELVKWFLIGVYASLGFWAVSILIFGLIALLLPPEPLEPDIKG